MAQQKKDKQQADKSPSASPLPSKRERSALTVIWLNTHRSLAFIPMTALLIAPGEPAQ